MKILRMSAMVSLVLLVVAIWAIKSRSTARAAGATQQQLFDPGCVSNVPRDWGKYMGGSAQSGLAFEDVAGTLRFLTSLPCGATPAVALEVRRTVTPKN